MSSSRWASAIFHLLIKDRLGLTRNNFNSAGKAWGVETMAALMNTTPLFPATVLKTAGIRIFARCRNCTSSGSALFTSDITSRELWDLVEYIFRGRNASSVFVLSLTTAWFEKVQYCYILASSRERLQTSFFKALASVTVRAGVEIVRISTSLTS